MATLSLAFLGPFTVTYDGQVVTEFRTRSVQALLAYLAVEATVSRLHQREALAELLWPGYPSGSARKNLRQALYELGRLIPEVAIEAGPPAPLTLGTRETLQINPDCRFELDTASFTRLVHDGSVEALSKAVELYRGDFLEDFALPDSGEFETWTATWRGHFRRQVLEALDRLAAIALQRHDYAQAESYARKQLALDDLRETAVGYLMQALAGQGQRTAALIAYDEACLRLQKGLGVEPAVELSELWKQIRVGEIGTLAEGPSLADAPSAQPADTKPAHNLPTPATPFIGRRTEVEQVKSLIKNADLRLLTLTGPGGIGKTRLSIQAASEVGKTFPDGVFIVPLASVQSADALVPAVAKAIDFSFYQDERPRQQLLDYLRERRLLLILDNFEHLIGNGARGLVGEMLSVAPGVKLVVTSRIRLNVQGEQLYPVAGMSIPDAAEAATWDDPEEQAKDFSAVQLFLERARRVQPDFALTIENVISVIEICRLVQGMPLGLELAAAWVELLPPDKIAVEISCSLDFLETDQAGVPDRQRSIRAVFESSWKLLREGEREAFLRLCVFVGGFSHEAAQQISGASLRTLLGLANKSWLQQTDGGRFQLHELMCQYGEERLKADAGEWKEAHDRHAAYFSGFVADQSLRMQGPEQLAGLSVMENEFDTNIKAAWDWLVAEKCWGDIIDRMALGFFQFGTIREQMDVMIPWLREARLKLAPKTGIEERMAFAILSTLELHCEDRAEIEDASPLKRLTTIWQFVNEQGLAEAMGFWFVILAGMVQARNLDPDAEKQLKKNIARLREQNAPWELGTSLLIQTNWWESGSPSLYEDRLLEASQIFKNLGVIYEQFIVALLLGCYSIQRRRAFIEITRHLQQAKQFLEKMDYQYHSMVYFMTWVWIYFQIGESEQGFSLFHEERRILERLGNQRGLAVCLHWESLYAVRYSTFEHALETRLHGLEIARKSDVQSDISWWLFELGEIYRVFGDEDKAVSLYEQARTSFEKMNMVLGLGYYQRAYGDIALEEARYSDALAHYQAFETHATQDNNTWSMAQAHAKLSLAHAYLENREQARLELHKALAKAPDLGDDDLVILTLLAVPVYLIHEGEAEQAVELAAFIAYHPASWNEIKQHARGILETASRDLPQEEVQAAIERGKALDLDSVVAELTKLN